MDPLAMPFKFVVDDIVKSHKVGSCKKEHSTAVMCRSHDSASLWGIAGGFSHVRATNKRDNRFHKILLYTCDVQYVIFALEWLLL